MKLIFIQTFGLDKDFIGIQQSQKYGIFSYCHSHLEEVVVYINMIKFLEGIILIQNKENDIIFCCKSSKINLQSFFLRKIV